MEEVGVNLVVEGLTNFLQSMAEGDSAVSKFGKSTSLFGKIWTGVGNIVSGLISGVFRILEYTLGSLLASAIRNVVDWLKELISAAVDAGNEFQLLTIRLNGINFQDAINSGLDYTQGMNQAVQVTKEQLDWIQLLAAATPFDPKAIANAYTMARTYGFADEEARRLTKDITEFTAGMGLNNDAIEKVIMNLGQMVQRGKITSTEMRDLARGAFLPLDDVLKRVAASMGITEAALTKQISKPGEGVPAQAFIDAFEQMVETEPRFVGASGRMARALVPAIDNFKQLFSSIGAQQILLPIFDKIGEKIASIIDLFVTFNKEGDLLHTERWDHLKKVAGEIGDKIAQIIDAIFKNLPSGAGIVDNFIAGMESFSGWLDRNNSKIVVFVQDALAELGKLRDWAFGTPGTTPTPGLPSEVTASQPVEPPQIGAFEKLWELIQKISAWINTNVVPAFNQISQWVSDNKDLILKFFSTLGEIVGNLFTDLALPSGEGGGLTGFLDSLAGFMQWVIDNKDEITKWAEAIIRVAVVLALVNIALDLFAKLIFALAALLLFLTTPAYALWLVLKLIWEIVLLVAAAFSGPVGLSILAFIGIVLLFILQLKLLQLQWEYLKRAVGIVIDFLIRRFTEMKDNVVRTFNEVMDAIKKKDWWGVGKALVDGIGRGIKNAWNSIIDLAKNLGQAALEAFNVTFGINSPSSEMFDIGEKLMQGFALGITRTADLAADAMRKASAGVLMPAMLASNSTYNSTNNNSNTTNYNPSMTVNTNARTEPIIQDFNMMQSLVGG